MGHSKKEERNNRAIKLANHMIETKSTVRQTAAFFGVSKSTVHKDVTERISSLDGKLAVDVHEVIEYNKNARYKRGGLATKKKYAEGYRPKFKRKVKSS